MYSRFNVLVNQINSLGVGKILEAELIHKILHSLQKTDYNVVSTILYWKELNIKSNPQQCDRQWTSQYIKPWVPPSSPTHSALTSRQAKKLKKMVIKENSSEGEQEDVDKSSLKDEKEEMNLWLLK